MCSLNKCPIKRTGFLFTCVLYQHTVTQWDSLQCCSHETMPLTSNHKLSEEMHLSTCDRINQNASKTRCKRASLWKSVSPFPIPQDAGCRVKPLASDKLKLSHSKHPSHCLLSRRLRQMDRESPCASHISIFDRACSSPPKITPFLTTLYVQGLSEATVWWRITNPGHTRHAVVPLLLCGC